MTKSIILEDVPHNNHGCSGFSVEIEITGERTGIVKEIRYCTANCHGIGGYNNSWWKEGQEIELPEEFASWDEASEWIEDESSFSSAGYTKFKP